MVKNGPQHSLTNLEIDTMCRARFKNIKYKGCFPSNKKPILGNLDCCIINNKTLNEGGEHWVALIKCCGKIYMYDSFARNSEKLSKHFKKEWIETNRNIEQHILEVNCGNRCISWLQCCDIFGVNFTSKII